MPDGNDQGCFPIIAIQCDIAAVAKIYQPFAIFRLHVLGGAPNLGMLGKDTHPGSDIAFTARLAASAFFTARKRYNRCTSRKADADQIRRGIAVVQRPRLPLA